MASALTRRAIEIVASSALAAYVSFSSAPVAFSAEPAEDNDQKARELHAEGTRHYDLAEYDLAIEAFKQAYLLVERPSTLFNIAQAYRRKGDCERAAFFYRNYLRLKPDAADREKTEVRIAEMDACAKRTETAREQPPAAAARATTTATDSIRGSASDERTPPWILWSVAGSGLAVAGAGAIVLTTAARGLSACSPRCEPTHVGNLKTRAGVAYALIGAGTATLLFSAVLALLGPAGEDPPASSAWVLPTSTGVIAGTIF
jgi:tetratricopeptide (TPR) repeat protein